VNEGAADRQCRPDNDPEDKSHFAFSRSRLVMVLSSKACAGPPSNGQTYQAPAIIQDRSRGEHALTRHNLSPGRSHPGPWSLTA
jgi:hypothetical protein